MPRIAGVDIPADKPIWISLTYLYGVGRTNSRQILKEAGIDGQRATSENVVTSESTTRDATGPAVSPGTGRKTKTPEMRASTSANA